MPGFPWNDAEKAALKHLVAQGLSARGIKRLGHFTGSGSDGEPCARSAMSVQKQMQRMGLVDPARSSMVKADKAEAWRGKDREACIRDLVKNWRETPVEEFAERWAVSAATIKYLLKQRGLGLSWKEAIRLKKSPFRNREKRREWVETFRNRAAARRERRRSDLIAQARQIHEADNEIPLRKCQGCQNVFPLLPAFFRVTRTQAKAYFSHICVVCSCARAAEPHGERENLMVRRNRDRLLKLRLRLLDTHPRPQERICWRCSRSWPEDKRFFKHTRSRATGKILLEHVCRLCRAERRRELSRSTR